MAKTKKSKITLSEKVKEALWEVDKELRSRGADGYDLCAILESLLSSKSSKEIIDQFVDHHTPESYKISQLLSQPEEREKILEFLQAKNFGMDATNGSQIEAQV